MPSPSLDDSYKKLARAGEHLADLQAKIREYREGHPYTVALHRDRHTGRHCAVVEPTQQPEGLGVIVGDCIYNLRAALDYLVYALAWLDVGNPQHGTQFPIADTPDKFQDSRRRKCLRGLSDEHIAAIERLQPYEGSKWLSLLASLSNADKHMRLHLVGTEAIADLEPRDDANPNAPPLTRAVDPTALNVHMDFDIALYEAFEDGTAVLETLTELQTQTSLLIQKFQPLQ